MSTPATDVASSLRVIMKMGSKTPCCVVVHAKKGGEDSGHQRVLHAGGVFHYPRSSFVPAMSPTTQHSAVEQGANKASMLISLTAAIVFNLLFELAWFKQLVFFPAIWNLSFSPSESERE